MEKVLKMNLGVNFPFENKYGKGKYETGPNSEFNKIRKWGDRNFK